MTPPVRLSAPQLRAVYLAEAKGLHFARNNWHPRERRLGIIVKAATVEAVIKKGLLVRWPEGTNPPQVVITDAGRAQLRLREARR